MDRAAELRELQAMRSRLPHMSHSAFSAVLTELRDRQPRLTSRQSVRLARDTVIDMQGPERPYGALHQRVPLQKKNGTVYNLEIINPFAMLFHVVATCGAFSAMFCTALRATPPSLARPWNLIMYADEVVPGNPLKGQNFRKSYAFYFSFMELGMAALSREAAWFTFAIMRTSLLKDFDGGISYVIACILDVFFGNLQNFRTSGCWLRPVGAAAGLFFFAELRVLLSDEKAIKEVWCCKGAGGLKPCVLCKNCIKRGYRWLRASRYFKSSAGHQLNKFDPHSDQSIWATVDDLALGAAEHAAGRMGNPAWTLKQKLAGFTHTLRIAYCCGIHCARLCFRARSPCGTGCMYILSADASSSR